MPPVVPVGECRRRRRFRRPAEPPPVMSLPDGMPGPFVPRRAAAARPGAIDRRASGRLGLHERQSEPVATRPCRRSDTIEGIADGSPDPGLPGAARVRDSRFADPTRPRDDPEITLAVRQLTHSRVRSGSKQGAGARFCQIGASLRGVRDRSRRYIGARDRGRIRGAPGDPLRGRPHAAMPADDPARRRATRDVRQLLERLPGDLDQARARASARRRARRRGGRRARPGAGHAEPDGRRDRADRGPDAGQAADPLGQVDRARRTSRPAGSGPARWIVGNSQNCSQSRPGPA